MIYRIEDTEYVIKISEDKIDFSKGGSYMVLSKKSVASFLIPYIERKLNEFKGVKLEVRHREGDLCFVDGGIILHISTPHYSVGFYGDKDHQLTNLEIQAVLSEYIDWFRD